MFQLSKDLLSIKKFKISKNENIKLPISSISNIIQTSDGKYKIIGKVTPVNADLMSDDEIEAVFEAIEAGLNSFDGRIGIYIQSQTIDIESNILNIESKKNELNNELKIEILEESKKYLEKLKNKSRNVLNFYIVLETFHKKYAVAENVLFDALNNFRRELENENMEVIHVDENEYKKIIYERTNPETCLVEPYQDDWGIYEISPKNIDRYKDGRHLKIDNRLFRFYYISRYPREVDEFRWLRRLLKVNGDINIAITLNPKNKANVLKELSNASKEISAKALDNRLPAHIQKEYKNQAKSADELIDNISSANSNLYDVNVTIGISGRNMDELNTLSVQLRSAISGSKCQSTEINCKEIDPFWVTLPILYDCKITRDYVWNLTSGDIASIILFDSSEMMEGKGTLISENVTSKGLVILDMLDRKKYNNGHMAVIADSGAGKTFFLMLDAIRHYPYVDYIIMFDVKGDFYFPWGKRYDFTPGSNIITNPFHIRNAIISSDDHNNGTSDVSGALAIKVMDLIAFFRWILPDMSPFDEALLEEDIRDCYKEVGLTFESTELPNIYPTFSTLEMITKKKIDDPDTSEKARESRINRIASLNPFIHGAYSHMFNGQTNWDYEPFTVFGINNVPEAIKIPLYEILLKDTWNFSKKDGTMNPPIKRIYVDEAHVFADPKNPQTLKFLSTELIKQGRGFGVYCVTATQNLKDYTSIERYGQAIIDNSYFKVFFRVGENDRPLLKELFSFSDTEMKVLTSKGKKSNKGRGLFIAGSQRVEIQVRASKFELEIIDPVQYEEIYKQKSRYIKY